jgi:hypothetical protein
MHVGRLRVTQMTADEAIVIVANSIGNPSDAAKGKPLARFRVELTPDMHAFNILSPLEADKSICKTNLRNRLY